MVLFVVFTWVICVVLGSFGLDGLFDCWFAARICWWECLVSVVLLVCWLFGCLGVLASVPNLVVGLYIRGFGLLFNLASC